MGHPLVQALLVAGVVYAATRDPVVVAGCVFAYAIAGIFWQKTRIGAIRREIEDNNRHMGGRS